MNLMDDNTFRWVQAVWSPLAVAIAMTIVTVALSGAVAIIATRMEAGRAEARARQSEVRAERIRALDDTYDGLIRLLVAEVNRIKEPSQGDMETGPASVDYLLIGENPALMAYLRLLIKLRPVPSERGIDKAQANEISDVREGLRAATRRQRDLILAGEEPFLPAPDSPIRRLGDTVMRRLV